MGVLRHAFTQWTLLAIGAGLLILMLVVAYLLWRQQQRDSGQNVGRTTSAMAPQPVPSPTITPEPSPTPILTNDQALSEQIKSQLMAYNPLGFSRYNFDVKEGVVTINGETDHQPEKDGVENILRLNRRSEISSE